VAFDDGEGVSARVAAGDAPSAPTPIALVAIIAAQVFVHAAMAGTRMAAPLEALRLGHGVMGAGILLALFAVAPVVLALPAGRLADRHGYHRPMWVGVAMTIVGCVVAALSTLVDGHAHLAIQALAALLCGAGANTVVIATQRKVGRSAQSSVERVRVFSWLGMAPALANAIGPVLAGVMIDAAGFGSAYVLMGGLAMVSLLIARRVRDDHVRPAARDRSVKAWSLLKEPTFRRLLIVNWLVSASWDVHSFAVPVLGHERGFSASTIGLILGVFTLSVTIVRFIIPALAARLDEVTVLRGSMFGTALVFAVYPLMPGPWTMACCAIVLGVFLGSVQPMILTTLLRITPEPRHGEALALRSMAINASSAAMPLAYGAVGALAGPALLFWAVGAAVGAGNGLARRLRA
jgi:MFS family permease